MWWALVDTCKHPILTTLKWIIWTQILGGVIVESEAGSKDLFIYLHSTYPSRNFWDTSLHWKYGQHLFCVWILAGGIIFAVWYLVPLRAHRGLCRLELSWRGAQRGLMYTSGEVSLGLLSNEELCSCVEGKMLVCGTKNIGVHDTKLHL